MKSKNSIANNGNNPSEVHIGDRNAMSVDTNGTSEFAFANTGELQAAIQLSKLVDSVHGIGPAVRDSICQISTTLKDGNSAQLTTQVMDGYANLVGALGRVHKASQTANEAVGDIAEALLKESAEAVSEPPCSDDSKVNQEDWDTVYDTAQDAPVHPVMQC